MLGSPFANYKYHFVAVVHADMVCRASDANVKDDIHVFGYRVHTHKLGTVVSGYKFDPKVRHEGSE